MRITSRMLFFDCKREKTLFIKKLEKHFSKIENFSKGNFAEVFFKGDVVSIYEQDPLTTALFFKNAFEEKRNYDLVFLTGQPRQFWSGYLRLKDSGQFEKAARYWTLAHKFGRI